MIRTPPRVSGSPAPGAPRPQVVHGTGKGAGAKKPKTPRTPEERQKAAQESALNRLYGQEGNYAGNALINKFMQEGAMGRVSTDLGEGNDILNRMKAGLGGYTSPEYQASREQMQRGLNSNLQTNLSQLAKGQARGRVYGAAATAQQANAMQAAQNTKDQLEQDLMVKNIDEQRSRLLDYNKAAGNLREEELGRQKFNIGQANAELGSQIGLYTGAGATALAKAQDKAAQDIQRQGIRAMGVRG